MDSLHYPPPGVYRFRYSITSGPRDWRANKSYRAGLNLNNPLIAVGVVDDVSSKSLPPAESFLQTAADDIVLSAVKKAGRGSDIVLRWYEDEGVDSGKAGAEIRFRPYEVKTIRMLLPK